MAHELAQTHGTTLTVALRVKTKDQANDFRFLAAFSAISADLS
ncbi:MAG: hypothetical protein AAFY83_08430 [Pseudomonadota bacterium]